MPKPDSLASAVIVSGGKQYRVAPGDRILVDRLEAEPGSSIKIGRVLLFSDGDDVKVGNPSVDGMEVDARVIAHRRGPRIESIRYKSKKRVRVHHGGRADLTALEIIAVGGVGLETEEKEEEEAKAPEKKRGRAKAAAAGRAQGASNKKKVEPAKAEVVEETPKKAPRRRSAKKESE